MRQIISDYLLSLGFVPNKYGYRYLYDLIFFALCGENILPLKYVGYEILSTKYDKNVACIEKDIQNAISAAWLKGNVDALYREFGETIDMKKGKPSNKQFIMTAVCALTAKL